MPLYHIDKSDFTKEQLSWGSDKVILTCDCESHDCPQLHIQTDEFIREDENYLYGILIDSQQPKSQKFRLRLSNAIRLLFNKGRLWPDAMIVDKDTARRLAFWILKVTGGDYTDGI